MGNLKRLFRKSIKYKVEISTKDIFGWDVPIWSQALKFWQDYFPAVTAKGKAIELASNKGGLSLFLASQGYEVICSDILNPAQRAHELHSKYKDQFKIHYQIADARCLPFENDTFDVVIFKSFLGYLSVESQPAAVAEIKRVLKPDGVLLFAENLEGSYLHRWVRRVFVPWGKDWNYVTIHGLETLFKEFSKFHFKTYGFLSLFFTNEKVKRLVAPVDIALSRLLPSKLKYVLFGIAKK